MPNLRDDRSIMVPHTRKKERRVICKEFGMKLIAITFLTVTAAFAQTAEPRLAITDAEKSPTHCAPVPYSSPKARRCLTGRRRLEANTGFFVKLERMDLSPGYSRVSA